MRYDRTIERKSVKSLKDLRSLIAPGHLQHTAASYFNLKNTIDGDRDTVKVAVYKFLSDYLERSIAGIVDALECHGYERDTIVRAVNMLVNEGCLASHSYGHNTDPQDIAVRLMEGRIMPDIGDRTRTNSPGATRPATIGSGRDPHGVLRHHDGIETAIWKATQDHAVRRLDTIVEAVRVAGFSTSWVKGEILLLEQRGWFEIDRSGDEPTCRLRDGIEMPAPAAAVTGKCQEPDGFDPAQPAEPGSLLAKVQQAQREVNTSARLAHAGAGTDDRTGPGACRQRVTTLTGREQICKVLAGGNTGARWKYFLP